jgi:hypothetical protein
MTVRLPPGKADRMIRQFEHAVIEHADLGTIPLWSDEADEQKRINRERERIMGNYMRARIRLLKALESE